ncbi:MAG: hypothetical protein OIF58_13090 [Cohaesibacter sp.]|nr:hypothetical protein [Cohaesibacter sp.]
MTQAAEPSAFHQMQRFMRKHNWLTLLLSKMAVLTIARVLGASLVFLLSLFITRQMGADAMARFSLFLAMVGLLSVIFPLGFPAIGTMMTAEYRSANQTGSLFLFAQYSQRLILLCALVLSPLLLLGAWLVPDTGGYHYPLLLCFAVPTAIAMGITYMSGSILVGLERPYWGQLPDILIRPTLMLTSTLVVWFIWPQTSLYILFALALGIYSFTAFIQIRARQAAFQQNGITEGDTDKNIQKDWWSITPNWMLITLLWDTFIEVHMLLAAWLVSPFEVAMLHVAFRIRQLAGFGMRALYSLLLPKVFAANQAGDKQEAQILVRLATRITFIYALAAWVGLAIVGPYIFALFGKDFVQGQTVLLIVMGTMVVRAIFGPTPAILGMERHQAFVSKTLIASLILSILLILAGFEWAPFGLSGPTLIALGYLGATTFTAVFMWAAARKKSGINCAIWS